MTIIKTITQECLDSILLSITNSYEQEMTELLSKYREGISSHSVSCDLLSNAFFRYFGQLTGIIGLIGGYGTYHYEMIDSLRSSYLVYLQSSLSELLSSSNAESQATEIPEEDEINFLDTESVTQQIAREVELEAFPAVPPVPAINPPKGHCAYCAAYLFSFPNNPGSGGRPSRYCSNACKMKAYRQRLKTVLRKPTHLSQRVTKVLGFAQPTGATQQVTL